MVDHGGEHLADKSTESFGSWLDRSLPSQFKRPCLGHGVWALLGLRGLGFGVQELGFGVWGLGFRVVGLGVRVYG